MPNKNTDLNMLTLEKAKYKTGTPIGMLMSIIKSACRKSFYLKGNPLSHLRRRRQQRHRAVVLFGSVFCSILNSRKKEEIVTHAGSSSMQHISDSSITFRLFTELFYKVLFIKLKPAANSANLDDTKRH